MTLDELAAFLDGALGTDAFPPEERGGIYRPDDGRRVRRLGVVLEAGPSLGAWAAAERLDALFLHRPWRLAPDALAGGVGVVWSHLPFDERLTTGDNPWLADALGMSDRAPLGGRDGRPLGMAGDVLPRRAAEAVAHVAELFGGMEDVIVPAPDASVSRVAVVGAMTDALVREAAALGAGLYVTGQLRQPARAAVAASGIGVVAVGHARAERYGLRTLARLVTDRWPEVEVRPAP